MTPFCPRLATAALVCAVSHTAFAQPASDNCSTTTVVLTPDVYARGGNMLATDTPGVACGGVADVYARFTPAVPGLYSFVTCGSAFDTILSVHDGCPIDLANTLVCEDGQPAGHFCSAGPDLAAARVVLEAGTEYFARVASVSGQRGEWALVVTLLRQRAANDRCANAQPVGVGTHEGTWAVADLEQWVCGTTSDPDLWYRFTAPAAGVYAFSVGGTMGPQFASSVALLEGCDGVALVCDTSSPPRLAREFTAGESLIVRITGSEGAISFNRPVLTIAPGASACAADFNASGAVDVADIFSFLSGWFAQGPGSDFNNSGATDVADIFAFLAAWFAGC